jgi:cytochrome c oxidase cbb3-type subunit 3
MRRTLGEAIIILVAGVLIGFTVNAARPGGLPLGGDPRSLTVGPGIELLSLNEARAAFDEGALFIDARPHAAFVRGHVEGSLSLPPDDLEAAYRRWWEFIPSDERIVVYAADREPRPAGAGAGWLRDRGHGGVVVFYDGWEAWKRAGLPQAEGEE